jgi:hypothetical protein
MLLIGILSLNTTKKVSLDADLLMVSSFCGQTISPGILSLPELSDGFHHLIQQRDQFDGTE